MKIRALYPQGLSVARTANNNLFFCGLVGQECDKFKNKMAGTMRSETEAYALLVSENKTWWVWRTRVTQNWFVICNSNWEALSSENIAEKIPKITATTPTPLGRSSICQQDSGANCLPIVLPILFMSSTINIVLGMLQIWWCTYIPCKSEYIQHYIGFVLWQWNDN